MSKVPSPGCKEVIYKKLISPVIYNVIGHFMLIMCFIILLNINIFDPVSWAKSTIYNLTSIRIWMLLLPLSVIIFFQGIMKSKDYVFEKKFLQNRFLIILNIFSTKHITLSIFHSLTGSLSLWLYVNIFGINNGLLYVNYDGKYYLNEKTFYFILNGFWIGFYYYIKQNFRYEKIIPFPVVFLQKFVAFKVNFIPNVKEATKDTLQPTLYFFIMYFCWGFNLRNWLMQIFGLQLGTDSLSVFKMINSLLLIYSWLFSSVFISIMLCMKTVFEIFATSHYVFPIESDSNNLNLKEALKMKSIPIIQHLACFDLHMLSIWDKKRRLELFSLSQPGGHPRNWNNILQEVIKILTDYTLEINEICTVIMNVETFLPKPKDGKEVKFNILPSNSTPKDSLLQSPLRLRNMALPQPEVVDIITVTRRMPFPNTYEFCKSVIYNKINNFLENIQNRPVVKYFFGAQPELRIYYLLIRGQPIIWSTEGLSLIAANSVKEDKYGVVQNDLAFIITTLINLKLSLEKLHKLAIVSKKCDRDTFIYQLRIALRNAVKRSLYSITIAFGDHLKQLPLTKEIELQIQNFLTYKEG